MVLGATPEHCVLCWLHHLGAASGKHTRGNRIWYVAAVAGLQVQRLWPARSLTLQYSLVSNSIRFARKSTGEKSTE